MKTRTWTDPIVDEVHRIREELARECAYDLNQLVARLQDSQKRHADRLVTRPPRRTKQ